MAEPTRVTRSSRVQLQFALLKQPLTLVEACLENALDCIARDLLFSHSVCLIAYTISTGAKYAGQPQATTVNELAEKIGYER
jgi:hypothetical protein